MKHFRLFEETIVDQTKESQPKADTKPVTKPEPKSEEEEQAGVKPNQQIEDVIELAEKAIMLYDKQSEMNELNKAMVALIDLLQVVQNSIVNEYSYKSELTKSFKPMIESLTKPLAKYKENDPVGELLSLCNAIKL